MNYKRPHYLTEAELRFTREEYEVLIELAKSHYDATCREAGYCRGEKEQNRQRYGDLEYPFNGFIAQLKLFPDHDGFGPDAKPLDVSTAVWTSRQIDLTVKILEQRDLLRYRDNATEAQRKLEIAERLNRELRRVFRDLSTKYEQLNPREDDKVGSLTTELEPPATDRVTDLPAENFMATIAANVSNCKLSDRDFRVFIHNTLPIVQYPRPKVEVDE